MTEMNEEQGSGIVGQKAKRRQPLYLALGAGLFLLIYFLPPPPPLIVGDDAIVLTQAGKICLGLLLVAIFYWITEVLPFHVTALCALLLMPVLGVTDGVKVLAADGTVTQIAGVAQGYKEIVRMSFGNDLILFFIGIFLLSGAFTYTKLGTRMTLKMLQIIGTSTRRVILGFLIMGALISMWVSDMGVVSILLPIGVSILRQAKCEPLKSNFGKALMISSCWGPVFGGIATPAGCAPNPIAISFMQSFAGMKITFIDWMIIGVPATIILIPFGWIVLLLMFPPEIRELPLTREEIRERLRELGGLSKPEIGTILIFSLVIFLWVFNPLLSRLSHGVIDLPISYVAILGGMLLFLPPFRVLNQDTGGRAISWDSILLLMASLGLGMMTYHTGAAKWVAVFFLGGITSFGPVLLIFVVVLVVIFIKLFLASNTVTGIIIVPILISLAASFNIHPWMLVAPAAFTSSLGIVLVTQTPTNIIPYTSGYFSIVDFAKAGIIMSVIMSVLVTLVIA
ncbi:MAG TPA: DASS family sodium-coupled anion symporter, partial [Deltaproteobacteria bacterium]|nr:DASS family sodium-coupled anion symporter [Deltaproteobacteria bacterium]